MRRPPVRPHRADGRGRRDTLQIIPVPRRVLRPRSGEAVALPEPDLPRARSGVPFPRRAPHARHGRRGRGGPQRGARVPSRGLSLLEHLRARCPRLTSVFPGFWKMAAKHGKTGLFEMARSLSKSLFVSAVQELIPEIRAEDMHPGSGGRSGPSGGDERRPRGRLSDRHGAPHVARAERAFARGDSLVSRLENTSPEEAEKAFSPMRGRSELEAR